MTVAENAGPAGWHEMLLALAGRIGDKYVSAARAAEDKSTRPTLVLAGAQESAIALTADDLTALLAVIQPGDSASIARALDAHAEGVRPAYVFSPLHPGPDAQATPLRSPSSEGEGFASVGQAAEPIDVTDVDIAAWTEVAATAVVRVAEAETGVRGVWAVRREPAPGTNRVGFGDIRVFLVEVAARAELESLATQIQRQLFAVGEPEAQVEVFATGDALPDYQRTALGSGALLWARERYTVPEVVPVFDEIHQEEGPRFAAGHPRLEAGERPDVAAYLYGAEAVILTTATMVDVMDPDLGEVVPLTFRTDGAFVWSDAVAYYADQYGLAPYAPLLEAIRAASYYPPRPDGVAMFRAESQLMQPAE